MEVLTTAVRQEKEIKGIQIRKEVKLSLFTDDMILYIESRKDDPKNLLELVNEFNNIAGYTKNELSKRGVKKTIPSTIASKRIKYLE